MFYFSLSVSLLLLFLLDAFTAANTNNPVQTTPRLSINCGSVATSLVVNGREWIGDKRPKAPSLLQIKGSSTASTVAHSSVSTDHIPHNTARISPSQFSYVFRVSPGEKIILLHFNPVPYKGFKRFNDLFSVESGPFTLLINFSASIAAAALGVKTIAKEFYISVEHDQILSITFSSVTSELGDGTYAFINGIEIIPLPLRLSHFKGEHHLAQAVGHKSLVYIDNGTTLELTHRVNVMKDSVSLSDQFYDNAMENEINSFTWRAAVDVGFRYLIRIHFSNLRLHGASLKVLVNEMIVDANLSIERDEYGVLQHRDYVVAVKGAKRWRRTRSLDFSAVS